MTIAAVPRRRPFVSIAFSLGAVLLACKADPGGPAAKTAEAWSCLTDASPRIAVRSLGPGVAFGVNAAGQVAGATFASPANDGRAAVWNPDGSVRDLFAGTSGGRSYAFDVNDLGAAAGVSTATGFPFGAFVWTTSGGLVGLPAAGGDSARARAINRSGQVAGDVEGGLGGATLWEANGAQVSLGTLGGPLSGANDVNDAGQVVGWAHLPEGVHHAFLWTRAAGMRDLGTLGGSWSAATGVNDLGHVTGWSKTAGGRDHAFLWTPEAGMIDLDPLGSDAYAEAVNDRDEIVGYHYPQGVALAFFWSRETGIVELGTLGGWHSRAYDLNDEGVVVGDSDDGIAPELATVWTVSRAGGPYAFLGFLPPIAADGSATFRAGRAIPVKFRLADAGGTPVACAGAMLRVFEIRGGVRSEVTASAKGSSGTGSAFGYDPSTGQYVYQLSTASLAPGAYLLRVELDDGSSHEVRVTLN